MRQDVVQQADHWMWSGIHLVTSLKYLEVLNWAKKASNSMYANRFRTILELPSTQVNLP